MPRVVSGQEESGRGRVGSRAPPEALPCSWAKTVRFCLGRSPLPPPWWVVQTHRGTQVAEALLADDLLWSRGTGLSLMATEPSLACLRPGVRLLSIMPAGRRCAAGPDTTDGTRRLFGERASVCTLVPQKHLPGLSVVYCRRRAPLVATRWNPSGRAGESLPAVCRAATIRLSISCTELATRPRL